MHTRTSVRCDECGSVQSSHVALWLDNVSDAFLSRIITPSIPFYEWWMKLDEMLLSFLGRSIVFLGTPLGFISFSGDVEKALSNRSRLLWQEATRRGIHMELLCIAGRATDMFRCTYKGTTSYFKSIPLPAQAKALRMDDKVLFKKKLGEAGLPVPQSMSAWRRAQVLSALRAWGTLCIKPRTGSNGRHTYPYVQTEADALTAFSHVRTVSPFASIEEHLEGNLCRATCVDGVLCGFLESEHPHLDGDGVSTIKELLAQMNQVRVAGTEELVLDASIQGYIQRRGYALTSILPQGERIQITYRGGRSVASTNREWGRAIHPSFIAPIERAAQLTELPVVGFDLIIPNPQESADSQKWGFIEANSLPWIDLHATPYYGTPHDLSKEVWDMWEQRYVG